MKTAEIIETALSPVLDFFAPKKCYICNDLIERFTFTKYLCDKCFLNMPQAPAPAEIYNRFVKNFPENELYVSSADALIDGAAETDYFPLVYNLKYTGFKNIGLEFGKFLGRRLLTDDFTNFDYIVPIPIHSAKKRERGFNQSDLIAEGVSQVIGLPVRQDVLARKVYTGSQTKLNNAGRVLNVKYKFGPADEKQKLYGDRILLIDDVITTGSTLNACAEVLLTSGARLVSAAAIIAA